MSGAIVYIQAFQKTQPQFNQLVPASNLTPGVYIMQIISGNQELMLKKFVKQ
jgi:hypothetical protein